MEVDVQPIRTKTTPTAGFKRRPGLVCVVAALCLIVCSPVLAGPTLKAVEVTAAPKVDGDISDACWQQSPDASDFYFAAKGIKAEENTSVRICYDQQNIYVSFHCYDSQPQTVKTQQKKRDGNIDVDDDVWIGINTYGTDGRIAWFGSNAAGVQNEYLPWNSSGSIQWRGDWYAAGKRVPDGYVVEMAIPFEILQYHPGQTSMRIQFERDIPRLSKYWNAPNAGPNNDVALWYQWDGLRLPKPNVRPKLMAYSLASGGTGVSSQRAGVDIKHSFTPDLVGLATINPYFGDVEQQVENIDFTYTEKYYDDSRPFFQEGQGYFPSSDVLYTRRIENVDAGLKLYGKVGKYSLALMNSQSFGKESYSVAQVGHEWKQGTDLWVCGVQGNDGHRGNFTGLISGNYRPVDTPDRKLGMSIAMIGSGKAAGSGFGSNMKAVVQSWGKPRMLQWYAKYQEIGKDYDPMLGYTPETDLRNWHTSVNMHDSPAQGAIDSWHWDLGMDLNRHLDGTPFHDMLYLTANCSWRNGSGIDVELSGTDRPPYCDRIIALSCWWGGHDLYKNGNAGFSYGKQAGGEYLAYSVGRGWPINDRLSFYTSLAHSHISQPSPLAYSSNQLISTISYDLDNERTLTGRIVSQKGNANCFLAYRQKVRKGTDAYLIFGDPNSQATKSAFTLKLIRLF